MTSFQRRRTFHCSINSVMSNAKSKYVKMKPHQLTYFELRKSRHAACKSYIALVKSRKSAGTPLYLFSWDGLITEKLLDNRIDMFFHLANHTTEWSPMALKATADQADAKRLAVLPPQNLGVKTNHQILLTFQANWWKTNFTKHGYRDTNHLRCKYIQ